MCVLFTQLQMSFDSRVVQEKTIGGNQNVNL